MHSKGIGFKTWTKIEKMCPEIDVWETFTPYFEKRNIHFYVNKCGFKIVEFFHKYHRLQFQGNEDNEDIGEVDEGPDEMFRFQKIIRKKE